MDLIQLNNKLQNINSFFVYLDEKNKPCIIFGAGWKLAESRTSYQLCRNLHISTHSKYFTKDVNGIQKTPSRLFCPSISNSRRKSGFSDHKRELSDQSPAIENEHGLKENQVTFSSCRDN